MERLTGREEDRCAAEMPAEVQTPAEAQNCNARHTFELIMSDSGSWSSSDEGRLHERTVDQIVEVTRLCARKEIAAARRQIV